MGIGLLDAAHRGLQRLSNIAGYLTHVCPVTAFGDLKAVVLGKKCRLFVAVKLHQCSGVFLVMNIRKALEEEQREHIRLEVSSIDWPAQDVGGFPKVRFELGEGDGHGIA